MLEFCGSSISLGSFSPPLILLQPLSKNIPWERITRTVLANFYLSTLDTEPDLRLSLLGGGGAKSSRFRHPISGNTYSTFRARNTDSRYRHKWIKHNPHGTPDRYGLISEKVYRLEITSRSWLRIPLYVSLIQFELILASQLRYLRGVPTKYCYHAVVCSIFVELFGVVGICGFIGDRED